MEQHLELLPLSAEADAHPVHRVPSAEINFLLSGLATLSINLIMVSFDLLLDESQQFPINLPVMGVVFSDAPGCNRVQRQRDELLAQRQPSCYFTNNIYKCTQPLDLPVAKACAYSH